MNIDSRSLPGRAFRFATVVLEEFLNKSLATGQANICTIMRRVFVVLPLVVAVQLGFAAYAVYVLLYFPITRFGAGYGIFWLVMAAGGAVIFLTFYLCHKSTGLGGKITRATIAVLDTPSATVLRRWLHDMHERICTPVNFVERAEHNENA